MKDITIALMLMALSLGMGYFWGQTSIYSKQLETSNVAMNDVRGYSDQMAHKIGGR